MTIKIHLAVDVRGERSYLGPLELPDGLTQDDINALVRRFIADRVNVIVASTQVKSMLLATSECQMASSAVSLLTRTQPSGN